MTLRGSDGTAHDVSAMVDAALREGLASRATDIHFEPIDSGLLIRFRVDGQLLDYESVSLDFSANIISRLKVLAQLLTYRADIPQEGSFRFRGNATETTTDETELRVATFPTVRGERAVVRVFQNATAFQSLGSLGFRDRQATLLRTAIAQPSGMIVMSGPAGSGKTTTLYAILRDLRDNSPSRSVITLEDPVEQRIDRVAQIQINPYTELGYERCMRSLLRQDPQVILIGEVRDARTAGVAIEAALTGHLILTTVHSADPAETIIRFLEMGVPAYQLVSALTVVCSQRLLRKRCRSCAGSTPKDCPHCLGTGYHGRTAIAQIARIDESVRTLILKNPTAAELREMLRPQGADLRESAAALVADGVTDEAEVERIIGATLK